MQTRLYRVEQPFDGRLAVIRRPRGGTFLEADIAGWRAAGVDVVVSMLEPVEAQELGLAHEGPICAAQGMAFINVPVRDHDVPDTPGTRILLDAVDDALAALASGRCVAAHCFAGMGRSPLFVASVLVRHGLPPDDAWERISQARGLMVPELEIQSEWLADLKARLDGA